MAEEVGQLTIALSLDSKTLESSQKDVEASVDQMGQKVASAGKTALAAFTAATAAAGAAVGKMVKDAVAAFAEYEQLVGGVETLFKDASGQVMQYADNAFKTAGMSVNEYMETVTSFSARLLQGLDGDTAAAAAAADVAVTDMADNANKMGTAIGSIQDAYQGFAKQNYTMLDNLKLGYGGTATEMARLINDSGVLGNTMTVTAETVNSVSFDKIIEAIHVVQTDMGITGTTAAEATSTIQGSVATMGAAWQNVLVGMADDTQDFDVLVSNLVESVGNVAQNIMPRIETALQGVGKLIEKLAPIITAALPKLISSVLPSLLSAATNIVTSLAKSLPELISTLTSAIVAVLPNLIQGITEAITALLPGLVNVVTELATLLTDPGTLQMILDGILQMILAIAAALPDMLVSIVNAIPTVIDNIVQFLTNPASIEKIVLAGVQLFMGLVTAIPQILGSLVGAIGSLLGTAIQTIVTFVPKIIQVAIDLGSQFIGKIVEFFSQVGPNIANFLTEAWNNVTTWVGNMVQSAIQAGTNFLNNIVSFFTQLPGRIWEFLTNTISKVGQFVTNFVAKALEAGQNFFNTITGELGKIPGKVFDIGKNIVEGIWNGISGAAGWLWDKITGFCSSIVDGIKSFFGIESPSTLFRDEVGVYMAQGIGVGFTEEMGAVNSEMETALANNMPTLTTEANVAVAAETEIGSSSFTTEEQRMAYVEAMTAFYEQLNTMQTEILTKLTTNTDNWINQIQTKVQQFTNNVIQKVTQFGTQAVQKAQEIGKKFHDKLLEQPNKLPEEFTKLGVDCIKGMEAGMRKQEPSLMAYVDSLCARIVAKIQAAMKIHSPSAVMRDEVGVFLAQGIGVGFSEEMEKVNAEMVNDIELPITAGEETNEWLAPILRNLSDNEADGNTTDQPLTVIQNNTINNQLDIQQVSEALLEEIRMI